MSFKCKRNLLVSMKYPLLKLLPWLLLLKDCLLRLNISLTKVRGQCYDGASNMSGLRKGVAILLSRQNSLMPFIPIVMVIA